MDLGLEGRTAAVAGASSGLGLASARALAAEGVRVAICGRDRARVEAAAAGIDGAVAIVADVSTVAGASGFVEAAAEALGQVDILVPNAGGPPPGTFASTPLEAYLPALELNLLSTVAMCEAAVPLMCERGLGSGGGDHVHVGPPADPEPDPVEHGPLGRHRLPEDVGPRGGGRGVTVNSVQPGLHATDRMRRLYGDDEAGATADIPAGTLGDPADFGAVVAFLCSEHARFVVGAAVPIDGGAYRGLQ